MSAKTTAPKTVKTAKKTVARKRGRASTFTPAVARAIIEKLSRGVPMAEICRAPNMPAVRTVSEWQAKRDDFAASIARARLDGFDRIAADCLRIADTQAQGEVRKKGPNGLEVTSADMLGHRKLQIETRLKLLAKWDPKRYGEKIDIEHTGSVDVEITIGGDAE